MMSSLIGDKFTKIIYNACEKKARQLGVETGNVQVCFSLRHSFADYNEKIKFYQENEGYEQELLQLYNKLDKELGFNNISEDDMPLLTYHFCKDYARKEEVGIMTILDVRLDILGYSQMVPPFIRQALFKLCDEEDILPQNIFVFATPAIKDKKKHINLHLYDFANYRKSLTLKQFLSEEQMSEEQATEENNTEQA